LAAVPSAQAQQLKFGIVSVLSEAETQAEFGPVMIQKALVELKGSPAGREVGVRGSQKPTGYMAADESLFDVVRRTAKVGGM
jgi:hypothetical protein